MAKTTPSDLAVAFRSLDRRLQEALDAGETPAGAQVAELREIVERAAVLMGSAPDAAAVADAISARPSGEWDPATLDALRGLGIEAGAVIRRIAERD